MTKLKLVEHDGQLAICLPEDLRESLAVTEGDEVYASFDGRRLVVSSSRDHDEAMAIFREGCAQYENALRNLAK